MTPPPETGTASADTIARLRRMANARKVAAAAAADEERCDLCGTSLPSDHRHMLQTEERRILCVCEPCRAMRAHEPGLRPTGSRSLYLDGFAARRRPVGEVPDPDRAGVLLPQRRRRARRGAVPEPGGRHGVRALPRGVATSWSLANPVIATLESDVEALVVNRLVEPAGARDRADRPLLRAGRHHQGELDGHLRRLVRRGRRRRLLRPAAAAERLVTSVENGAGDGPRRRSRPMFTVVGVTAAEDTAVPALRFHARGGGDVRPRRVHDRPDRADQRRSGAARVRRRRRASGWPTCSASPSDGPATTHSFLWAHATTLVPSFTGQTAFSMRRALLVRPRARGREVLLQPAGRRRAAQLPLLAARSSTAATTARCRSCSCRGRARRSGSCRSTIWRGMMERFYPNGAWARLHADTVARLRRRQLGRGSPSLDACIAELLDEAGRRAVTARPARGAARHAAVRGLRALPVHAGRRQERDADAVRHRLPAGLRRHGRQRARPAAGSSGIAMPAERLHGRGRGALPGAGRPTATRTRRPSAGCSSARCRSASGAPRARRPAVRPRHRVGARCGSGVRARSAGACRASRSACTTRPSRRPHRRPGRGAALEHALHASGAAAVGRPLRVAARARRRRRRRGRGLRERQHLPGPRDRRRRRAARRRRGAARPPAAGAREPRRPVRRHRDRGGAAAARARAQRRRAGRDHPPGPGRAGHDRARRRGHAGTTCWPCTGGSCSPIQRRRRDRDDRSEQPSARGDPGRGGGRPRRRRLPPRRQGDPPAEAPRATRTTASSTAASRRSSASTTTTTTSSTSASRSTTTPVRT